MNIADVANNSRNARRFVLYDPSSQITVDEKRPLIVSSAVAETGYSWQTPSNNASTCWFAPYWQFMLSYLTCTKIGCCILCEYFSFFGVFCAVLCVRAFMCACVRSFVRAFVRSCVHACVRACVRASVRVCVCACVCICVCVFFVLTILPTFFLWTSLNLYYLMSIHF